MMEMNYIVRNAGRRSLVIIDELCKETSVLQGNAICWSFCEALLAAEAWVLGATHSTTISRLEDVYFTVAKCVPLFARRRRFSAETHFSDNVKIDSFYRLLRRAEGSRSL